MNQPPVDATGTSPSPPAEQAYPATSGMQLGYGIGEAELSAAEEEYRALVRTLRRSQGFGLLFVECSPATGTTLVQKLQADLPQKSTGVLSFAAPVPGGNLYHQVQTYLQTHPVEVLFLQGLEYSIFEYEEVQRRLSSWTEEQIYTISWEGLPPLMRNLNWYREDFRDNLPPVCLVFLVRSFFINYLLHRAPDFFDWRSGLFHFPLDKDTLTQQSHQALGDYTDYLAWSSPQRVAKILELKDLLEEPHQTPDQKADLLVELSNLFSADQRYEEAIASYDRAIAINPNKYNLWQRRGTILIDMERYEEALDSFNRVIQIKPDNQLINHLIWITCGILLSMLNRDEEAITRYDHVLQENPDESYAWHLRASSLHKLERHEEAIASLDRAIEIEPDSHEAWSHKGASLNNLKQYQEAIEYADRAIQINPEFSHAWYVKGYSLNGLGLYEEAIASFDQAITVEPEYATAIYSKAYTLSLMGDVDAAIKHFQKAFELDPQCREIAKHDSDLDAIRRNDWFQALIQEQPVN